MDKLYIKTSYNFRTSLFYDNIKNKKKMFTRN